MIHPVLRFLLCLFCFLGFGLDTQAGSVELLDTQYDLPEGFHIYRYLDREEFDTGYSLAFDRQGRLYVGDGQAIRRVEDTDGDHVADRTVVIAEDLGDRGPQGLLFFEDRIFANGNRQNWVLEDLDANGVPGTRRAIGGPVETGGDHHAHGYIRGMDGYVYWLAGNDSKFSPQGHITEANSPIRDPLGSTVFRISPDGKRWEALGTGCRNPFDIGMNYLGEFLTVDSDHEGQIGLPYYRPVRVTHYTPGARMGWLSWGDGKLQPYQIDCHPGLFEVGRGSPCGIVFYEHNQFPAKYSDVMFMGDYMNKRGENLEYATTGQILVFHLERDGATWKVAKETFARPSDESGAGPKFAVIDMTVAPDGSLLATTRSNGVLRIYYDPKNEGPKPLNQIAGLETYQTDVDRLLHFPQPIEAWAIDPLEALAAGVDLKELVNETARPVRDRLRALRLLAPQFESLDKDWLNHLAQDEEPEIRAQAVWLLGMQDDPHNEAALVEALRDEDNLVQRRALEALARLDDSRPADSIVYSLGRKDHWVRFAAMHALSHRTPDQWMKQVCRHPNNRVRLAGLTALSWRPEAATPSEEMKEAVNQTVSSLWIGASALRSFRGGLPEDALLEILRVTEIWRGHLAASTLNTVSSELLRVLESDSDHRVVMESSKLAGKLKLAGAIPFLAERLPKQEGDPILQLQMMDDLASLPEGWSPEIEAQAIAWMDASDTGWHGDLRGKGSSYPGWWQRIVQTFVDTHTQPILARMNQFNLSGPFGEAVLKKAREVGAPAGVGLAALEKKRAERVEELKRALLAANRDLKSNEEIRKVVLSDAVKGGMPALGADLFNYMCLTCHAKGSAGARRGPNLDQIRSGTPELLIDSILEPNRKVDEAYRSRYVTLKNGDIITGTLLEETDQKIVVAGEGDPVEIPKSEIERITVTDTSAMPENQLNSLTWNEIRDLWAYLREGPKQGS